MNNNEYLDQIAREAHSGDYRRTGVLSKGELLYVALASGRMRELCPGDSIPYAVSRVGQKSMAHMETVWRSESQPQDESGIQDSSFRSGNARYQWIRAHPKFPEVVLMLTGLVTDNLAEADEEIDSAIAAVGTLPSIG